MSKTPKADLWFSLFLIALGAAAAVESWRMPRLEHLGINPMSVPGLTPGILGAILALLGLSLFLRSVLRRQESDQPDPAAREGWLRLAVTLGLCLLYAAVLLGWLPFWLATGLFVFAFVLAFSWLERGRLRALLAAAMMSVVTPGAVTLLFARVFLVRLP